MVKVSGIKLKFGTILKQLIANNDTPVLIGGNTQQYLKFLWYPRFIAANGDLVQTNQGWPYCHKLCVLHGTLFFVVNLKQAVQFSIYVAGIIKVAILYGVARQPCIRSVIQQ